MASIHCFLLLCFLHVGASLMLSRYTDCGGQGKIHSFSLDPCTSEPCHIVTNANYTGKINFTASVGGISLRNELHGLIAGALQPWNIYPTDACGNGVHCPLQPGLAQVFTAAVETPKVYYYHGRLVGKWEVKDENDRNVICIAFGLFFNV